MQVRSLVQCHQYFLDHKFNEQPFIDCQQLRLAHIAFRLLMNLEYTYLISKETLVTHIHAMREIQGVPQLFLISFCIYDTILKTQLLTDFYDFIVISVTYSNCC